MGKTAQMRVIELQRGKALEQVIQESIEAGMTWDALAADLGVTRLTLRDWRRRLGCKVIMQPSVVFSLQPSPVAE